MPPHGTAGFFALRSDSARRSALGSELQVPGDRWRLLENSSCRAFVGQVNPGALTWKLDFSDYDYMVLLSRARLVATNQTTGKGDFRVPDLFGCSTCIHGPLVPPFPSAARARTPTHGRVPRSARSESSGATLAQGLGAFAGFSCTSCDVPPRFPRDSPRIFRVLCVDCVRRRIRRNGRRGGVLLPEVRARAFLYHDRWRRIATRAVASATSCSGRAPQASGSCASSTLPTELRVLRAGRSSRALGASPSGGGDPRRGIPRARRPHALQRPPHLPRDP